MSICSLCLLYHNAEALSVHLTRCIDGLAEEAIVGDVWSVTADCDCRIVTEVGNLLTV